MREVEGVTGKYRPSEPTGDTETKNRTEIDNLMDQQKDYYFKIRQLSKNTYQQKIYDVFNWQEKTVNSLKEAGKYDEKIREQIIRTGVARIKAINAEYQKDFMDKYEEMNMTKYDMDREAINRQGELWKKAGADKIKVEEYVAKKISEINKAEQMARLEDIQTTTGMMADNFKSIAEMGGKYSKEAFGLYKAFKITETIISTYSGAMKAYESMASIPYVGPALGAAAAATVVAFGLAQVAAIRGAQPPSYDMGGISRAKGIYQTGPITEAHVPIPSGKIPVKLEGTKPASNTEVHIHLENSTFYDQEKQQQVFAQISEMMVWRVMPEVYRQNYSDDGVTRQTVRGRG